MKRCLSVVLAASLIAALGTIAQAEYGMPSQATLRAMGLSGMLVMSDEDAMNIRGFGFQQSGHSTAIAFGISYAKINGHDGEAGSLDGYYAEGKHYAAGEHGSYAGVVEITKNGRDHKGGSPKGGDHKGGGPKGGDHKGGGPKGGDHNGGRPWTGDQNGGNPRGGDHKGGSPKGGDHKGGSPKGGDHKGGSPKGGGHMGGSPKGGGHMGGSPKGGDHRGGGRMNGGHMGGPKGGSPKGGGHKGGGGQVRVKATVVFAGGHASSSAY